MGFCSQCGSQMDGQFCGNCGATAGAAAPPAAAQPTPPPPGAAAPKKSGPLKWILIGCAGLILVIAIVAVSGGLFVLHKAKQAGLDPDLAKRNPALAAAKMMAAMNPDVEVVSTDEGRGVITLREKKTGKTVTLNFEDVKKGRISFEGEGGEKVEFQGGEGGSVKLPSWLAAYPGATASGGLATQGKEGATGGTAGFTTRDPASRVVAFYESEFKRAGMKVSKAEISTGLASVTGEDEARQRKATAMVTPGDDGTVSIALTYETKN